MNIVNGIIGFIIGIMAALLFGIIEMKLFKKLQWEPAIPFAIGITIIACTLTGIILGVKWAKRH